MHSIIERLELIDEGTIPVSTVENAVETAVQAERNLELLAERFHLAARQIQSRHAKRPTLVVKDEYDVQDLLHALLTVFFDDVRPEEWAPSHAGAPSRMDYLLPEFETAVEAKMTRPTLKARELGEELIIDIAKYQRHPGCRKLFCVVYDPDEHISNPRGLEADLSGQNGKISVRVMIVPRRH